VRVSVWFLYVSVCGLLCLFLLLKNAGNLKEQTSLPTTTSPKTTLPDGSDSIGKTIYGTYNNSGTSATQVEVMDEFYNILTDKGQLVVLYFGGIIVLTLIFFVSLR